MIDWNNPNWGQAGQNTHEAENGSWVEDRKGGH